MSNVAEPQPNRHELSAVSRQLSATEKNSICRIPCGKLAYETFKARSVNKIVNILLPREKTEDLFAHCFDHSLCFLT